MILPPYSNVYVGKFDKNQFQDNAERYGFAAALHHVESLEYSHELKTLVKTFNVLQGPDASELYDTVTRLVIHGR